VLSLHFHDLIITETRLTFIYIYDFFYLRMFAFKHNLRLLNKLQKCIGMTVIEVQCGVYLLIGINELGLQSRVHVYIIYAIMHVKKTIEQIFLLQVGLKPKDLNPHLHCEHLLCYHLATQKPKIITMSP